MLGSPLRHTLPQFLTSPAPRLFKRTQNRDRSIEPARHPYAPSDWLRVREAPAHVTCKKAKLSLLLVPTLTVLWEPRQRLECAMYPAL